MADSEGRVYGSYQSAQAAMEASNGVQRAYPWRRVKVVSQRDHSASPAATLRAAFMKAYGLRP